jgi:UDP-N-acetylmuramate dehydrogenase
MITAITTATTATAYPAGVAIEIRDDVPLGPLTTLELGGRARHFVEARNEGVVTEALRWADDRKLPVALLGGGSNLVVADAGFAGLVVRMGVRGRRFEATSPSGEVTVTASAGEPWDDLVADTVARDLAGLECLSGIPGLVGATPIQNVGAYGQEVAQTVRAVRVLDRGSWKIRELAPADCGFGYRASTFKRDPERFVVLAVTFGLRSGGAPTLSYRELASALAGHARPPLADVRAAVLALRRDKSMLDKSMSVMADDPNRRSVGSFFMNPVVTEAEAAAVVARAVAAGVIPVVGAMPSWPADAGHRKLSAGWLIEKAGVARGLRRGPVGVSSAHALALVHHGGGSTAALVALGREIRDTVRARFGLTLVPEPTFLGLSWNPETA